jgi:hypothetical protein
MFMLSAYMDETGHFEDKGQRFVGMAGLIAPAHNWQRFETKWKAALQKFQIPHFHMVEFAGFKGEFEGWSEIKRRNLMSRLLTIIDVTYGYPFGSVIPLDVYRSLSPERQKRFKDPYFLAFMDCIIAAAMLMAPHAPDEKMALVFSEQRQFRAHALRLYDHAQRTFRNMMKVTTPIFRDMREIGPLQAADLVAYEFYKEADRLTYRPEAKIRHPFERLLQTAQRSANFNMINFHDKESIEAVLRVAEQE